MSALNGWNTVFCHLLFSVSPREYMLHESRDFQWSCLPPIILHTEVKVNFLKHKSNHTTRWSTGPSLLLEQNPKCLCGILALHVWPFADTSIQIQKILWFAHFSSTVCVLSGLGPPDSGLTASAKLTLWEMFLPLCPLGWFAPTIHPQCHILCLFWPSLLCPLYHKTVLIMLAIMKYVYNCLTHLLSTCYEPGTGLGAKVPAINETTKICVLLELMLHWRQMTVSPMNKNIWRKSYASEHHGEI